MARLIVIVEGSEGAITRDVTMDQRSGDRRVVYQLAVIGVLAVALVAVLLATMGGGTPTGGANATMVPSIAATGSATSSGNLIANGSGTRAASGRPPNSPAGPV